MNGVTATHEEEASLTQAPALESSASESSRQRGSSYAQIFKSTAVIGGSSIITIVVGIIRTKAVAVLVGPLGVGLLGLYSSLFDLAQSIAGMGINSSGVRQIAESAATHDRARISRTVNTLRRVTLSLGIIGALLLLVLSRPIAIVTFGSDYHRGDVAVLSLAVLFGCVSGAQRALVQGMRRIADLARLSVLGGFWGALSSILILYIFRERGIAASIVCIAGMGVATSWWYARKVKVEPAAMTFRQVLSETSPLLKLGFVFMSAALATMLGAYLVRLIVRSAMGVTAVGFYQAAWVIGGLYVGFILQAMGADFYPRLTAVAKDDEHCNRLVNEQAEVSLLLAGPGLLATLTFSPLVIALFYSAKFGPAVEILRWVCLGMMLRVGTWPMGFIQIAKGAKHFFFWTQVAANAIHVTLVWVGVQAFGLRGAGIAFFGFNLIHWFIIRAVARSLSGFRWSTANRRICLLFVPLISLVFVSWYVLPPLAGIVFGTIATLIAGACAVRTLGGLVPLERLPQFAQNLVELFYRVNRSFRSAK
jgi:antigen flippase